MRVLTSFGTEHERLEVNLQALKEELDSDPLGRGYSGMSDVAAADSLNTPDRQPDRETLDAGLFVSCLDVSEYVARTTAQREYVQMVVAAGSVPLTANVKTEIGSLFPAGSATRTNILAALKRTGSRAEELGLGRVTPSHIADARRL